MIVPHQEGVEDVRPIVLVCVGLLMCSPFSGPVLGRDDAIEVLCLTPMPGIPYWQQILRKEPMFDVTYVPSERESQMYHYPEFTNRDVQKGVRMYFPRNYEYLTGNYEFILLLTYHTARTDWDYFTDQQVEMMRRGIEEGGLGALRDQSTDLDYGSAKWRSEIWAGLSLSDAFPDDVHALLSVDYTPRMGSGRYVINDDPSLPPVLKPYRNLTMYMCYPYDTQMGADLMIPRQGSQTYLWRVSDGFLEYAYPEPGWIPNVLGWRYGEGYTWSLAGSACLEFFASDEVPEGPRAGTYLYGHDALFGLVMYGAGRDPPLDVMLVHEVRERFGEYADAKSYIESMIDFVEKFEVNINPLLVRADELRDKWEEGRHLYLAQEWEDSKAIMDGLADDMRVFTEETLAFKDRALLWVYVTEWAAVSAVSLLSGFTLWTLMISRRLYKMVDQTKLRPPPGETGAEFPQHSKKEDSNPPWEGERECSRFAIS